MDVDNYGYLLDLVSPYIRRENSWLRKDISQYETFHRHLEVPRNREKLSSTRPSCQNGLSLVIPETREAIYKALKK